MGEPAVFRCLVGFVILLVQMTAAGCERRNEPSALDLPVGSIQQEIRIGSLNEPDYTLTEIAELAVAPDGRIYSLHPEEALIRRWSPAGEALGTIGRRGEGPGEFMSLWHLGWRGDSLWVFDVHTSRISFFDTSGLYLGALTPALVAPTAEQAARLIFPPRPAGLLGDGSIHGATQVASAAVVEGRVTSIAHVRMNPDGSIIDTVVTVPIGRESVLRVGFGGGGMVSRQPFGDGVLATLTRDGRSFLMVERPASRSGGRSEFRLHRVELDGDTVYSRSFPYVPVPIPADTIESYINAKVGSLQGFTAPRGGSPSSRWLGAVREAMYTPDFYPPVSELVAGRDGTIWMALNPSNEITTEWLVLGDDGEVIGTVALPRAMNLMVAERSMVWGTERDEFDVDYIVRYGITFPETKQ